MNASDGHTNPGQSCDNRSQQDEVIPDADDREVLHDKLRELKAKVSRGFQSFAGSDTSGCSVDEIAARVLNRITKA